MSAVSGSLSASGSASEPLSASGSGWEPAVGVGAGVGAGVGVAPEVGNGDGVGVGGRRGPTVGSGLEPVGGGVGEFPDVTTPPGAVVVWATEPVAVAVAVAPGPVEPSGDAVALDGADDSGWAVLLEDGESTTPTAPPTGRNTPPTVKARTITTMARAVAATDRRSSNRRKIAAIERRNVLGRTTTMGYATAQAGHAPAASAQHQRQAYRLHSAQ